MFKIWVKLIDDERKTIKDYMYINEGKFDEDELSSYLFEVCSKLDICTPVVLNAHKNHYARYNIAKFVRSDFIEDVTFFAMTIENGI